MKLSNEKIEHLASLARIGMSGDETSNFGKQLSDILDYLEILDAVDATNTPPTIQPIALINVLQEDIIQPSMTLSEVLVNAPEREEDYFRVRAIHE